MAEPEVRIGSLEESTRDVLQDTEMTGDVDEALEILEEPAGDSNDPEESPAEETPKPTYIE